MDHRVAMPAKKVSRMAAPLYQAMLSRWVSLFLLFPFSDINTSVFLQKTFRACTSLYKPKQVKKAGKLQVQPARFDFSQVWSKFPWLLNYTRATCQICFVSPFQHLHWSPKCACGTIRSPICQCWLSSSSTTMAIFSCFLPLLHHFFFFGSPFPA